MKVFVAVLALVAVAAAEEMNIVSGAVPVAANRLVPAAAINQQQQQRVVEEGKIFSIYAAPSFAIDADLEQEKVGFRSLYDMPFFVIAKNLEKNAFEAYLLKDGFRSLYTPEFGFLRNEMVSGNKVGLMLSAVRYLDMPELVLPLESIKFPQELSLAGLFNFYRKSPLSAPVMMLADVDVLRSFTLDKLNEIGAFSLFPDKVQIYARATPIANQYERSFNSAQHKYGLVQDDTEFPYSVYPAAALRSANGYSTFPITAARGVPSYPSRYRAIPTAYPAAAYPATAPFPRIYHQAETAAEEAELPIHSQRFPITKGSPNIVYIA